MKAYTYLFIVGKRKKKRRRFRENGAIRKDAQTVEGARSVASGAKRQNIASLLCRYTEIIGMEIRISQQVLHSYSLSRLISAIDRRFLISKSHMVAL